MRGHVLQFLLGFVRRCFATFPLSNGRGSNGSATPQLAHCPSYDSRWEKGLIRLVIHRIHRTLVSGFCQTSVASHNSESVDNLAGPTVVMGQLLCSDIGCVGRGSLTSPQIVGALCRASARAPTHIHMRNERTLDGSIGNAPIEILGRDHDRWPSW